uniref:UDP-Gal or UDP-GlcNAc-dependent glycosyltransferase n=2 Tax=Haemonchus contortus TaxID=6289 RepID=A0A912N0B3_HAECO
MPAMNAFRRLLPRRGVRDEYSFELLRSSSAQDMMPSSPHADLPRYYSNYDHVMLQTPPPTSIKSPEETDEFASGDPDNMSETSALIGFVSSGSSGCSYGFAAEDPIYEKAIAECCVIKENPSFSEGILLKCVDKQPMFPYLHFAQFHSTDHHQRQREIDDVVKECRIFSGSLFGAYEEVYSIQKTTTSNDARLPSSRHAGYIVVGFKILDDSSKQHALEKSWLSWSGAREIYKHSPRVWNLRRISLRRNVPISGSSSRPFAYILMCEFSSILHPSNTIQALDMCERLRVRNCGHIALYQVHTSYSTVSTTARKPYSNSLAAVKRQTMMRGLSHDVASIPSETTEDRRGRLRVRDHSFQYSDEHYTAYQ